MVGHRTQPSPETPVVEVDDRGVEHPLVELGSREGNRRCGGLRVAGDGMSGSLPSSSGMARGSSRRGRRSLAHPAEVTTKGDSDEICVAPGRVGSGLVERVGPENTCKDRTGPCTGRAFG